MWVIDGADVGTLSTAGSAGELGRQARALARALDLCALRRLHPNCPARNDRPLHVIPRTDGPSSTGQSSLKGMACHRDIRFTGCTECAYATSLGLRHSILQTSRLRRRGTLMTISEIYLKPFLENRNNPNTFKAHQTTLPRYMAWVTPVRNDMDPENPTFPRSELQSYHSDSV